MARAISRRHLLVLAGAGLAAAAIPASLPWFEQERTSLADELVSMLADPGSAATIGRQWLASMERGGNASVYAQKIAKRLRAHGWRPGDEPEKMHAAIAARVRHEFAHDDVVEISGWQIARTDAELCALAAASLGAAPSEPEQMQQG